MLYSILIPTLVERRAHFAPLHEKLESQIRAAGAQNTVEIRVLEDNREQSLGAKRNALVHQARGEFCGFVDDDDDVAADYVTLISDALSRHPGVDCLGIRGIVYFRGARSHPFVYSLQYDHYFSRGGIYYRPPIL